MSRSPIAPATINSGGMIMERTEVLDMRANSPRSRASTSRSTSSAICPRLRYRRNKPGEYQLSIARELLKSRNQQRQTITTYNLCS
jgi:hypothetical protein